MQRKPINSNSRPLATLQPGSLASQVGYLNVKYGKVILATRLANVTSIPFGGESYRHHLSAMVWLVIFLPIFLIHA